MQIPLKKDRKRKTGGAAPKKNGGRVAKKRNLTGIIRVLKEWQVADKLMYIHNEYTKYYHSEDFNVRLKGLNTQLNKPTNQN